MKKENPILTVCLVTYNHEKYIHECMEHFRRQNTTYPFEILVGDDMSTDRTVDILRDEYSDIAEVVKRTENLGLSSNLLDLYLRARGKYVFAFAGDDYLSDDDALYKMIDFLEQHEEYNGVSYWNSIYNEKEDKFYYFQKDENPTEYSIIDFLSGMTPPCYSGMIRNTFRNQKVDASFLAFGARNNEEIKTWAYQLSYGKLYILHEYLHTYRYVNRKDADNYCSNHGELEIFKDYYADIKLVQERLGTKYNFLPLKLSWFNRYCIKFSNTKKDFCDFLNVLSWKDKVLLIAYKIYLKTHQYNNPVKWSEYEYLVKEK